MTDLPPYVILGNLYDALSAAQLSDVVMHSFCVQADRTKLQAWLDRAFATPSGGAVRYEAVGDKVFLSFAEIGQARGAGKQGGRDGYVGEIDTTIWLMARRLDDGLFALRWIPVYLFVDSGTAQATGREVWGFPKQLGEFDFTPQKPDRAAPRTFDVKALVVETFAPGSKASWHPIFEARPLDVRGGGHGGGVLATLEAFAEKAVSRLTDGFASIALKLQETLGGGGMVMAMLKQFPDAADPTRACYQGIIEAHAVINGFRGSGLTDNHYEVRVTSYASHPFLDELGISADWQDVGQGVWMDFDFEQHLGAEIWRATAP